jgi:hypothetical protein
VAQELFSAYERADRQQVDENGQVEQDRKDRLSQYVPEGNEADQEASPDPGGQPEEVHGKPDFGGETVVLVQINN